MKLEIREVFPMPHMHTQTDTHAVKLEIRGVFPMPHIHTQTDTHVHT